MRFHRVSVLVVGLVLAAFNIDRACAQPAADRVPDTAIVYVGWCGSENLPSQYQGSHLQAIAKESNVKQFFDSVIPNLIARAGLQNKEVGDNLRAAADVLGPMLRHPTAIYFDGIDMNGPQPMPRIGLVCKAGAEVQALNLQIATLQKQAQGRVPLVTAVLGNDTLVVQFGTPLPTDAAHLADSAGFKSAIAKLGDPSAAAMVAVIDGPKLLAMVDDLVTKAPNPEIAQNWPKVREASGLAGLGHVVWTSGFDGKDWSDQLLIEAPSPRKGILQMLSGGQPVSDDLLKVVPSTATHLWTGTFDLGGLVEGIRGTLGEIDKNAQMNFDRVLGFVTMAIGRNFQKDILDPLGAQWAVYQDPETGGLGIASLVLVNKVDDPQKAMQGVNIFAMFVANTATSFLQRNGFQLGVRQATFGDAKVNYFATPLVSPAWTMRGDKLFLALYPQTAATASKFAGSSGAKSILDNPDFAALRARLAANHPIDSISFSDLKKTSAEGYQTVLMLSQVVLGGADMWGVKAPPQLAFPPLQDLLPLLGASGAVSWADEEGLHMKSITPFPGADALGCGSSMVAPMIGSQAMMVSILLPSLNRARETANRVKCASNERQIAQAMLLYSNDHQGKYPQTLGELIKTEDISIDCFVCPSGNTSIPPGILNGVPDVKAQWIDQHSDYIYLGAGKTSSSPAEDLLIYERPRDHDNDGCNMTYGDGHVEFQPRARMQQELQRHGINLVH